LGDLDEKKIHARRQTFKFREIADSYRIIDVDSVPVVIGNWYRFGVHEKVDAILNQLRLQPRRSLFRKLAPFQVNMRFREATTHRDVQQELPGVFVWRGHYDPDVGITDEVKGEDLIFG
jgi:hypothetical protein